MFGIGGIGFLTAGLAGAFVNAVFFIGPIVGDDFLAVVDRGALADSPDALRDNVDRASSTPRDMFMPAGI